MTYRDRREARAERLRGWADKREAEAEAEADADWQRAGDMASGIPFGQPVLEGHYSEGRDRRYRARIAAIMDRSHADKARSMRSKAGNIEGQLAESIYDDDPDAIAALEARIVEREAERDRVKAYNASCRKGAPDLAVLDDAQRAEVEAARRVGCLVLSCRAHHEALHTESRIAKERGLLR